MQTSQEMIARARELMQSMRIAEAEALWSQLAERHPGEAGMRTMQGVCRKLQGDVQGALQHLNAAVELDEHHADSHFQLGQLHFQLGKFDDSRKALKRAVAANPNHIGARIVRAQLELREERPEEAARALRMALRADADNVQALAEMTRVMLALGREEEAERHAAKAVQLSPGDPRAQIAMSSVFQARGQWDFAEQGLINALESAPNSGKLWAALGGLYQAAGRDAEAVRAFERAEGLGQDGGLEPVAALIMIDSLCAVGRRAEARRRLEALGQRVRLDGDGLLLLAELRVGERDLAGARQLLPLLAESLDSGRRLVEAWLAEAEGRADAAAEIATGLHEVDHEQISLHARMLSGRLAVSSGDPVGAESALAPLLRREPVAGWMLADVLRRVDQHDRAREVLETALQECSRMGPESRAMTHARLAWLLDEMDEFDAAGNHLERTGWQGVPLAAEMVRQTPRALHDSLMELKRQPWSAEPVDDGWPQAVFVLGWPGSGREPVVQALIEAGLPGLDAGEAQRRRRALGLPLAMPDLEGHDQARVRIARRRYFRGVDQSLPRVLEPMWVEATALPALARFFPGATVVVPDARDGDLELHWRLSGFGRVEDVLAIWKQDRELLDHLRPLLDLRFVDLPRSALDGAGEAAAGLLADALDLDRPQALARSLAGSLETFPLKPEGRWRHYRDVLTSAASSG